MEAFEPFKLYIVPTVLAESAKLHELEQQDRLNQLLDTGDEPVALSTYVDHRAELLPLIAQVKLIGWILFDVVLMIARHRTPRCCKSGKRTSTRTASVVSSNSGWIVSRRELQIGTSICFLRATADCFRCKAFANIAWQKGSSGPTLPARSKKTARCTTRSTNRML